MTPRIRDKETLILRTQNPKLPSMVLNNKVQCRLSLLKTRRRQHKISQQGGRWFSFPDELCSQTDQAVPLSGGMPKEQEKKKQCLLLADAGIGQTDFICLGPNAHNAKSNLTICGKNSIPRISCTNYMDIKNLNDVAPFTTKDGSEKSRELLAHRQLPPSVNQSRWPRRDCTPRGGGPAGALSRQDRGNLLHHPWHGPDSH